MEGLFAKFPFAQNDGLQLNWSHRTNSTTLLESALNDPEIHLIEADVQVLNNIPVIAHDKNSLIDMDLENFINLILNNSSQKGVKLDFKTLESVQVSFPILQNYSEKLQKLPVFWLNADVLPSLGSEKPMVDSGHFLELCEKFLPWAPLSLGWAVPLPATDKNALYSLEMAQEMYNLVSKVTVPVTLAVRAGYLEKSLVNILWLLRKDPKLSVTFWHGNGDILNADILNILRSSIAFDRVFYDLPREIVDSIKG